MKTSKAEVGVNQESLWDEIHARQDWPELNFVPNDLAIEVKKLLPPFSRIIEVGCSNGRDARYLASFGHNVVAIDFSEVALVQMMSLAKEQECAERIIPIRHNIAGGLPNLPADSFDCFYARSSLHVNDDEMIKLAEGISLIIKSGGLVAIEGRTEDDESILDSEKIAGGLAINWKESGHLRRIWTKDFCTRLSIAFSWQIAVLAKREDGVGNKKQLLRFIARKDC